MVREVPKPVRTIEEEENEPALKTATNVKTKPENRKKLAMGEASNWEILEKSPPEDVEEISIGDCELQLSGVDRLIWKGIPKARLIEYYHSVSKYMLPHLKDRPRSLHVKPNGFGAPGYYVKDMEGRQPECAAIFRDERRHPKPGKCDIIEYLVCNNEPTLLYMVNLGCIDINPWLSRMSAATQPDFFNIDLDPGGSDFHQVVEVTSAAKQVLNEFKLRSFVKTSGKIGMHIYVPVTGIRYGQARAYSEIIGTQIHDLVKDISTITVSANSRKNKVFIDPSQNDYTDTLTAAYSVRPNRMPTVSTPLDWKEVRNGLDPNAFTIDTIGRRLAKKGDLFKAVLDKKIAMANSKILNKHF